MSEHGVSMTLRLSVALAALCWAGGALLGCDQTPLSAGLPEDVGCSSCHGNSANAAPPVSIEGATSTSARGVGAHQSHLVDGNIHKALACSECHVVPDTVEADGHIDPLPAELTFGDLATTNGVEPAWDPEALRCSNVYCHGATVKGGRHKEPLWTVVDGSQASCDSCHGFPPPDPHPRSTDCAQCHSGTVTELGTVDVASGLHINGTVDKSIGGCDSCHGGGGVAAPPVDLEGNTETTAPGVGAHRQHLGPSDWHKEVQCSECHIVPAELGDAGHVDTPLPAELSWGPLAAKEGAGPLYDRPTTSCSGVYCHGSTLEDSGGTITAPNWTVVDGSQAECGTCHALPPLGEHPPRTDCSACHGDVVDADGKIIGPNLHIDGVVEVGTLACDSCHGGGGVFAPPVDTKGNSATTEPGVGAHREHLGASDWHKEVTCATCHVVPETVNANGHIDSPLPAELTWTGVAVADGAQPAFNAANTTCSGVYCHGTTLDDGAGTLTVPDWTLVDGTQAKCGTCHALPPAGDHPTRTDCASCHGAVVNADGQTFKDASLHIDGKVDLVTLTCSSCHGSATNAAPPVDTQGATETTNVGVGAHQEHLGTSDWHKEVSCTDCHKVPTTIETKGHIDSPLPAELTWSGLAMADSAKPSFDPASATCSGTYCHGTTLGDAKGTLTEPVWTQVDGTQAACGTCHMVPPAAPHPPRDDCESCHGAVIGAGQTFVNPALHVNGTLDLVELTCSTCHGSGANAAPPVSVTGQTATTEPSVGAHQQHLVEADWHGPIACTECHKVPGSVDAPGHIDSALPAELTFGPLATSHDAVPSYSPASTTCSGTYCHGSTLGGGDSEGTNNTPDWTVVDGTQAACGTCHGFPPGGEHPDGNDCQACHACVIETDNQTIRTDHKDLHINGVRNVDFQPCP